VTCVVRTAQIVMHLRNVVGAAMRFSTPDPVRVAEFLQDQRGLAFCARCIQDRLNLISLSAAQRVCSALALRPGFDRRVGICSGCGSNAKKVIRVKPTSG
jgi:hypothetical protein